MKHERLFMILNEYRSFDEKQTSIYRPDIMPIQPFMLKRFSNLIFLWNIRLEHRSKRYPRYWFLMPKYVEKYLTNKSHKNSYGSTAFEKKSNTNIIESKDQYRFHIEFDPMHTA